MILEYHPNGVRDPPMMTIISQEETGYRRYITYHSYMLGAHTIHTYWGSPKPFEDPLRLLGIPYGLMGSPKARRDPPRYEGIS